MSVRRSFVIAAAFVSGPLFSGRVLAEESASPVPRSSRQLVLVHSTAWAARTALLERYERSAHGEWKLAGEPNPVNLGRSGLAWGRGLHGAHPSGPVKREGDGRSPAGVFPLSSAFGVASDKLAGFPYLQTRATSYCVEDTRSAFYNQLVDSTEVKRTGWEQWSELRRADGLFDWGVVVQQNEPAQKGAGSCVFLHIWRGLGAPTAGCTSMARERIESLVHWLDEAAKPMLVQLPDPVLEALVSDWQLPKPGNAIEGD